MNHIDHSNTYLNTNYQAILSRYLTTGNIIFDIILSSIVIGIMTKITERYSDIIDYIIGFFTRFDTYSKVNLSGTLIVTKSLNTKEYFSDNFKAIRHYIISSIKYNKKIKTIQEVFMGIEDVYDKKKELFTIQNDYKFLSINEYPVEIYPYIYYTVNEKKKKKEDTDKTISMIEYNYDIELYSKKGVKYILDFVENCREVYEDYVQKQCIPNLLFIKYNDYDLDDCNVFYFNIYPFYSAKTFNTIYHDNKKEIISTIDFFNNNKLEYEVKGKPYNLGFIFHGEPGCGKTSTIKAIANYTQRHIVEISLSKIKTNKELEKLFFNTKFNKYNIPQSKLLYVLEDFDADCDILFSREYKIEKTVEKKKEKKKEYLEDDDEEINKISLGSILNILDGILERHNQILIFTTNHFNKLDKALIRPGRFDKIIEFKKASNKNIMEMYETYYNEKMNGEINVEYKYTQAEIINLLQNTTKEDFIKKIEFKKEE